MTRENTTNDLAKGKGDVDEDGNEDFVGDPGQARKPFAHTDNLSEIREYFMNYSIFLLVD